jgi:hypothetical protein
VLRGTHYTHRATMQKKEVHTQLYRMCNTFKTNGLEAFAVLGQSELMLLGQSSKVRDWRVLRMP